MEGGINERKRKWEIGRRNKREDVGSGKLEGGINKEVGNWKGEIGSRNLENRNRKSEGDSHEERI